MALSVETKIRLKSKAQRLNQSESAQKQRDLNQIRGFCNQLDSISNHNQTEYAFCTNGFRLQFTNHNQRNQTCNQMVQFKNQTLAIGVLD